MAEKPQKVGRTKTGVLTQRSGAGYTVYGERRYALAFFAWRTRFAITWRSSIPLMTDFRFHDLRYTWASWLIQSGVPPSVLWEMGGWESIEMVRRYAHLAPNHLTEHARQIDSIFEEDVPNMSHTEKSAAGGS